MKEGRRRWTGGERKYRRLSLSPPSSCYFSLLPTLFLRQPAAINYRGRSPISPGPRTGNISSNGLSLPIILHFLGWGLRGAGGDEKVDEQQSLGARHRMLTACFGALCLDKILFRTLEIEETVYLGMPLG